MEKSRAILTSETRGSPPGYVNAKSSPPPDPGVTDTLDELHRLREERCELHRTLAIHDELVSLALDGAGFGRIATTFAQLVGNPVLIENRFFRTLGQAMPSGQSQRGGEPSPTAVLLKDGHAAPLRSRLQRARETVTVPAAPAPESSPARLIAPIVVGDAVVGFVSILERDRLLTPGDSRVIRVAAQASGVEFARQQAAIDTELRLNGNLLDVLLQSAEDRPEAQATRASLLGYDLGSPQTLLLLAPDSRRPDETTAEDTASMMGEVGALAEAWARRVAPVSLVAPKDGHVAVLLASASERPHRRLRETEPGSSTIPSTEPSADPRGGTALALANALREELTRLVPDLSVSIALAAPVGDARELPYAYEKARQALGILKLLGGRDQIMTTVDPRLAVFSLFDSTRPEARQEFVDLVLGPLIAYDQRRHRALVPTLEAYLLHGGNLETTARSLNVHTSTLKYRLQRIREVSGVDVHDANHRFNADLALRLRKIDGD